MISADTKTDVKQEIKELVAPSSLILSVKNRGWMGFYLTIKIWYAWQKLFVGDHLMVDCFHLNSKITSIKSFHSRNVKISFNTTLRFALIHRPAQSELTG